MEKAHAAPTRTEKARAAPDCRGKAPAAPCMEKAHAAPTRTEKARAAPNHKAQVPAEAKFHAVSTRAHHSGSVAPSPSRPGLVYLHSRS